MMSGYWQDPLVFLLSSVFNIAAVLFWIRALIVLTSRDRFDPVLRSIVRLTEPVLAPLRHVIPTYRGHEIGALLVLVLVQVGFYFALAGITGLSLPLPLLPRLAAADLTVLLLNIYTFSILIQVLLSWISPGQYPPAAMLLFRLTGPLLDRARRLLPDTGMMDFSPLLVLLVLQVLKRLIAPLGTGL